ncbi:P-loop containing nucleoside triphosphate hydrolase protein [Backusella circina FSU 941]|nr:P-loop containing nucleoside triphosphate hydrolase protein [Backusella circina FSU 941]
MSKRNIKYNCANNDIKKQKTTTFNLPELTNGISRLKNIFERLNVFCAFCSARLTGARLTFEGLKKAVPDLTIEELAGINVILPSFIHFEYVVDEILELDFGPKKKKKKNSNKPMKTDAIKKIIDDNQHQFLTYLDQLLQTCKEKDIDPDNYLKEKRKDFIPILPTHTLMEEREKKEELKPRSLAEVLDSIKEESFYSNQLVQQRTFSNKIPKYGQLEIPLSPEVSDALNQSGIKQLYIHQTEALNGLCNHQNVIVSTSTASGKSLIYQIPVLESLLRNKNTKAIYLFPTKALAQDQKRAFQALLDKIPSLSDIKIDTFDGDTPTEQRRFIRSNASSQLLPTRCSIFIHMETLCGINNVKLIEEDGAPCGKKEFIVWNPPLINPSDARQGRKHSVTEGAEILEYFVKNNIRTIVFCKVRKTCELVLKQLRENLQQKQQQELLNKIMTYRGGYTPQDRRRIESQLFNGDLIAVIATNALELGVDIGSLDAVIMVGVPWSISSLWQQSGRSGRRSTDSLSLVITDQSPLDQYYAKNPNVLFEKKPEKMSIGLENSLVLESHLQCAAEEMVITIPEDEVYFGSDIGNICGDHLFQIELGKYRPDPRFRPYPQQFVHIRNVTEEVFAVVDVTNDRNVIIEEIEISRAGFEIYQGAIFIHQGVTYHVEECNIDQHYAKVRLTRVDWTTRQRDYTNVDVLGTMTTKHINQTRNFVTLGKVKVKTVVFGYYRLDRKGHIMDSHDVYMDPFITFSTGVWADVPGQAISQLKSLDIDPMAAIHASSHCLITCLPRYTTTSPRDIRTECKNPHATRQRPNRVALYEFQPSGVSRKIFEFFDQLLDACIKQIENCPCELGCPSCIHLSQCSENNEVCSKEGAVIIFHALQGSDVSLYRLKMINQ